MRNPLYLFWVFVFLFMMNMEAQTYEFINQTHFSKADTAYVYSDFSTIEENVFRYLNEVSFRENWQPLPTENLPDINNFLSNFDLHHAKEKVLENNLLDKQIDFYQLDEKFVGVTDTKSHLKSKLPYTILSRPIFNEDEDWAICYHYSVFYRDVGNSGNLRIYRKVNGNWEYYWQIMVWIS
ncbi:MAG: hypothetical protein KJN70_15110 [Eudoraea sp.]|nr:hypothetical protein [Eudoraea sp.]